MRTNNVFEQLRNNITNLIISITIIITSGIISLAIYSFNDRSLMARNIETAMGKGVDPLSVRCSYAAHDDTICVAYAITHGNANTVVPQVKK